VKGHVVVLELEVVELLVAKGFNGGGVDNRGAFVEAFLNGEFGDGGFTGTGGNGHEHMLVAEDPVECAFLEFVRFIGKIRLKWMTVQGSLDGL